MASIAITPTLDPVQAQAERENHTPTCGFPQVGV
jgi:hypothetical protein